MPIWTSRGAVMALAIVFAMLVANALVGYFNVRRLHRGRQEVQKSHDILYSVDRVLTTLLDAETGTRGYLLTGDEVYLQPYQQAVESFDSHADRLSVLVEFDSAQASATQQLFADARHFLGLLENRITVRRVEGLDAVVALVRLGESKRAMDGIRKIINTLLDRERERLAQRDLEAEANYATSIIAGLVSTMLSLSLATAAYVLVRREIETRARVTLELRLANERLEQRVEERTRALRATNEQLGEEIQTRRQAEQEASNLTQELQRSNRELEQFASVASHDMQEPLRKIQAFGDRLNSQCRDQLGEKGQDYLVRILSAAGRMRRLIDDLLAYSRVSTKGQPFVEVDLRRVATEVVDDLEQRIQETDGSVSIGELPTIAADPLQMRQLFQNLIANALKFHQSDVPPLVRVTGQQVDGQCQLTVADNGIGFEPVYSDRIFNLFQRLHARETYEGTGIGLAICKKIVERHGGSISADSSPGKGATFTITLPVSQESTEDQP